MRPENELILVCAKTHPGPVDVARIMSLAPAGIDWEYAQAMASQHGVVPLLFHNLNKVCPEQIPSDVRDHLSERAFAHTQRNLMLLRELVEILELLKANQIPAIPYKGPLLAISAYGDISLRQIRDLDIIVHARDISKVKDLLLANGFELPWCPPGEQEALFFRSECELEFINARVELDVHWRMEYGLFYVPIDLEPLWQRLVPLSVAGKQILTLAPQDLLLILCFHGAKHVWERLDWICSVSELVRTNPGLPWTDLFEKARSLGTDRMVMLGLLLAEQLLGTRLPDSVTREIASDAGLEPLAEEIRERLFTPLVRGSGIFTGTFVHRLHPRMFRRLRHRIRYYYHAALTPTAADVTSLNLPAPFSFAYSALRPLRLLTIYGPKLFKHDS